MNRKLLNLLCLLALASPSYLYAQSAAQEQVNQFINGLAYNRDSLLALAEPGSTRTLPVRQEVGNAVIVCTNNEHDLQGSLDKVMALSVGTGVVYPGALVEANRDLAEGRPDPVGLPRAPLTISSDLPGAESVSVETVNDPSYSTVNSAIQKMVGGWLIQQDISGSVAAPRYTFKVEKALSEQQVALALGFDAKWAGNSVSAEVKGNYDNKSSSAVAMFQQTYYTVAVDTPPSPASIFPASVSVQDLKQAGLNADNPPAYIQSVEYGRLIMVRMDSTSSYTAGELKGAFQYAVGSDVKVEGESGGTVSGSTEDKFKSIAENSSFSILVLGGNTEGDAISMNYEEFSKRFPEMIKAGLKFTKNTPAVPISYSVVFLKQNKPAMFGFNTKYIDSECTQYNNGQIAVQNSGAFVARFKVSWQQLEQGTGNQGKPAWQQHSWQSGSTTSSYRKTVDIPGDAKNVEIYAEEATGLVWEPWREAMKRTETGPTNKCYRIYGTTLNARWDNNCPM